MFLLFPLILSTYSLGITTTQNFITIDDIERVYVFPSDIVGYPSTVFFEYGEYRNIGFILQDPYMRFGGVGFSATPFPEVFQSFLEDIFPKTASPFYRLHWGNGGIGLSAGISMSKENDASTTRSISLYSGGLSKRIRSSVFSLNVYYLNFDNTLANSKVYSNGDASFKFNYIFVGEGEFFRFIPYLSAGLFNINRMEGDQYNVVKHTLNDLSIFTGISIVGSPYEKGELYLDLSFCYSMVKEAFYDTTDSISYGTPITIGMKVNKGFLTFSSSYRMGILKVMGDYSEYNIIDKLRIGAFLSFGDLDIGGVFNNKLFTDGPYFITGRMFSEGPMLEFTVSWKFRNL